LPSYAPHFLSYQFLRRLHTFAGGTNFGVQHQLKHEQRIRTVTDIHPDKTSNVVIYKARVGDYPPTIDYRDALEAMRIEGNYPASPYPIDISISGNLKEDDDSVYWQIQLENLEEQFNRNVRPLLENDQNHNHFSIFAFAPIPLLIKLGTLFSDKSLVDVYQLKKDPSYWNWEDYPSDIGFSIQKPDNNNNKTIALNLSLSASIDNKRIFSALSTEEVSIWKMDINNSEFPKNDHLRTKNQLVSFKREFRKLLDEIKFRHGQSSEIHLFAATPIAYSIEIGRVRQEKADLPIFIYDQNKKTGGFKKIFRIE